jgi:hypothetical protein
MWNITALKLARHVTITIFSIAHMGIPNKE